MSYRVLITDEATDDVFDLVKYIHVYITKNKYLSFFK